MAGTSIEACLSYYCDEKDFCTGPSRPDGDYDLVKKYGDHHYRQINNIDISNGMTRFHNHEFPLGLYSRTGSRWEDYYKITCARNPWDLFVSYYWWTISKKENSYGKKALVTPQDSKAEIRRKFRIFTFTPVKYQERLGNMDGNETLVSPVDWLSRSTERFICSDDIDFFIQFENLRKDTDALFENLGLGKREIKNYKTSQRSVKIPYTEYYDDMTKKYVEQKFSFLVEKFKYKF